MTMVNSGLKGLSTKYALIVIDYFLITLCVKKELNILLNENTIPLIIV